MQWSEKALPQKICVLLVGEQDEAAERVTSLGSWWLMSSVQQAWQQIESLIERDAQARILMDMGEVLTLNQRWRGEPLERMSQLALGVRQGNVVLSQPAYEQCRALDLVSQHVARLELHSYQSGAEFSKGELGREPQGDAWWQISSEDEPVWEALTWRVRTNIRYNNTHCVGRQALIEQLDDDARAHRIVEIVGTAGVGKTMVIRRWLEQLLLEDSRAQVWWVSMMGLSSVRDVAAKLAQLWRVELPDDVTQWAEHLGRRFSAETRHTWLVLDDMDVLDADAEQWLASLMASSRHLKWLMTSRVARQWHRSKTLEVEPLSFEDALNFLDWRSAGALDPPMTQERMRWLKHWAEFCQGHALTLDVVARAAGAPTTSLQSLAFKATDERLDVGWRQLSSDARDALFVLSHFSRVFDRRLGEDCLSSLLPEAKQHAAMLDHLIVRGWIQESPDRDGLWVPTLIKQFVGERVPAAMRPLFMEWMIGRIERWIEGLNSSAEPESLIALSRHDQDIVTVVRTLMHDDFDRCVDVMQWLTLYFLRALSVTFYAVLLDELLEFAQANEAKTHQDRLNVFSLIVGNRTSHTRDVIPQLVPKLEARRAHTDPLLMWEVDLIWANYLNDCADEQVDRQPRFEIVERVYNEAQARQHDVMACLACSNLAEFHALFSPQESLEWAERAQQLATSTGVPSLLSRASFSLHRAYMGAGRLHEAKVLAQRACDAASRLDLPSHKAMMFASLGYACLYLGQYDEARRHLHMTVSLSKQNALAFGEANGSFLLGMAYMADQQLEAAKSTFAHALSLYEGWENAYNTHMCRFWHGAVLVCMGVLNAGEAVMREARTFFEDNEIADMDGTLNMLSLLPDIHRAGWLDQDKQALEKLEAARLELEHKSVRLEAQIVKRFIEQANVAAHQQQQVARVMLVDEALTAFCPPDEDQWVSIRRRKTLRRVFGALVDHHRRAPGEVIEGQVLFEAGWPGEQPETRSGMMRLYVAINALRKLGLEGILETTPEGYRLDPAVELRLSVQD